MIQSLIRNPGSSISYESENVNFCGFITNLNLRTVDIRFDIFCEHKSSVVFKVIKSFKCLTKVTLLFPISA